MLHRFCGRLGTVVNSDEEDLDSKLALAELYEATNKRDLALALVNDGAPQALYLSPVELSIGTVIERRGERGMDDGNLGDFLVKQRQLTASRQQQLSTHTSISRQERIDMERELQEDVLRAFKLLAERETKVDEGDVVATREWIDIAAFLVDNFRENKQLFPHDQVRSTRRFAGTQWFKGCTGGEPALQGIGRKPGEGQDARQRE